MSPSLVRYLEVLFDLFCNFPRGTFLALVFLGCFALLLFVAYWIIYTIIDTWFLTDKQGTGIIKEKRFVQAYTETRRSHDQLLNLTRTEVIHHPDTWWLTIETEGKHGDVTVHQTFYDHAPVGTSVLATYSIGRLSRQLFVRSVSPT